MIQCQQTRWMHCVRFWIVPWRMSLRIIQTINELGSLITKHFPAHLLYGEVRRRSCALCWSCRMPHKESQQPANPMPVETTFSNEVVVFHSDSNSVFVIKFYIVQREIFMVQNVKQLIGIQENIVNDINKYT